MKVLIPPQDIEAALGRTEVEGAMVTVDIQGELAKRIARLSAKHGPGEIVFDEQTMSWFWRPIHAPLKLVAP